MSANDAEILEHNLRLQPDDFDARARLLGYYNARAEEAPRLTSPEWKISIEAWNATQRDALTEHAVWFATNASRSPLAGHRLFHFPTSASVYSELSSIWRRQVAADPTDPMVFANAISFFWRSNAKFADELLSSAEARFPDDARWRDFRHRRRAYELDVAFRFRAFLDSPAHGGDVGQRVVGDQEFPPPKMLDEIEHLLHEGDPEAEWQTRAHEIAGEISLVLGRFEQARAHAEQMVALTGESRPYRDAVHNGHLLLGRIALRENDTVRARVHLTLAGQAGAPGLVPIFGPDMRLAAELLSRGEREVVIRYLSLCRSFWGRGPIDEWISQIRAGDIPDFSKNLKTPGLE